MLVCPSRISHHPAQEDQGMKASITGNVQGVGFRAETKFLATRLQLKGTVRNCLDGTVEIIAQGPKEKLDLLIHEIKKRFTSHSIENIDLEFYPIKNRFLSFDIRS